MVFWDMTKPPKTLVSYITTQCHNTEDNKNLHHHENLLSCDTSYPHLLT